MARSSVAQEVEPIGDIAGMAQLAGDPQMGAQKRSGELRHQFLGGGGARAEAIGEVAIQAGLMPRPMVVMPMSALWPSSCSAVA